MARLIYSAITSLDGYIEDEHGKFDWAAPDPEVHAFVNDRERPVGTYLYGRRMYETMAVWETVSTGAEQPSAIRDYAQIWRSAEKIVYSTTLTSVTTARTRLERDLDPGAVRTLKERSADDLTIGGPDLAGTALRAGLVDEIHLFVNPIAVGGGKPALPAGVRIPLALLEERRFASGVVYAGYRVAARDGAPADAS